MHRIEHQLFRRVIPAFLLCLACFGCRRSISDRPVGRPVSILVPLGLPPVPIPTGNPPTAETIALGRRLFYDSHLSSDNTLACSSCHKPQAAFTDGLSLSRGVTGSTGVRNAPTVENAAYLPLQFWDGRAATLELQAASPIADPLEMNQPHDVSVSKLSRDPVYRAMFRSAFGSPQATIERVEAALASFERTLLSGNSAFDRYQYAGDRSALTPSQVRGLQTFLDPNRGNCAACHTLGAQHSLFTDGQFHNTGEGVDGDGSFADIGRYHETKVETDKGAFMTPTLRDIAETAPYMHNGRLSTLQEVVDFYAGGGNSNPDLDPEMKKIHLTGQDRADLVDFLRALTGPVPPNSGPPPQSVTLKP